MPELLFTRRIEAPLETVWEVMTDHHLYSRWTPARKVTLDKEGSPDRNGLGAVRVFHAGPFKTKEQITEWEPLTRMAYVITAGPPVRDFASELRLEDEGGATVLRWESQFAKLVPGTGRFFERVFSRAIDRMSAGIKEEAESRAAQAGE